MGDVQISLLVGFNIRSDYACVSSCFVSIDTEMRFKYELVVALMRVSLSFIDLLNFML